MASSRKTAVAKKTSKAKKVATSTGRAAKKAPGSAITLEILAERIDGLSVQVASLVALLSAGKSAGPKPRPKKAKKVASPQKATLDLATFVPDLLSAVRTVDRRGRHGGMVPIPAVRDLFLERGVARKDFDARLLDAERDFVVDLKSANDPSRLADPDQAVRDAGRGHLQFVVIR